MRQPNSVNLVPSKGRNKRSKKVERVMGTRLMGMGMDRGASTQSVATMIPMKAIDCMENFVVCFVIIFLLKWFEFLDSIEKKNLICQP